MHQLVDLALQQPGHRNAGGLRHHLGDVAVVDLLLQHAPIDLQRRQLTGGSLDRRLHLRQAPVDDLGGPGQIAGPLACLGGRRQLGVGPLQFPQPPDGGLLGLPVGPHVVQVGLHGGQLGLQGRQPLLRRRVGLLGERHPLQFQLRHPPVRHVHLGGHRVHLHAQHAGRLIDEVYGLVGQEAVRHVPVGQVGGRHQRHIGDAHAVVHLVALTQPPQDGDGVLHRRLADQHRLEAPLQGGVGLHVRAVLVEGGGADHVQVAAGQGGLQHVGGVEGAVSPAGPHHHVHLVDERDDAPVRRHDLGQHGLQPLLELAPQRRPRHHGGDVQGDDLPVRECAGHIPGGDPLGEPLHDRRLAHAGLTNEDRVVLRAPGQHLNGPADLIVPPDHRIQLVGPSQLRQIPPKHLQSTRSLLRHPRLRMTRLTIHKLLLTVTAVTPRMIRSVTPDSTPPTNPLFRPDPARGPYPGSLRWASGPRRHSSG